MCWRVVGCEGATLALGGPQLFYLPVRFVQCLADLGLQAHPAVVGEVARESPGFFQQHARISQLGQLRLAHGSLRRSAPPADHGPILPSYSSASLRASSRASSRALRLSSALFSASSRAFSLSFAASSPPPPALAGEGEAVGGALGEAVGDGCPAASRAGPVPTVTSTALPLSALVPAAGSCPTTVPRSASPLAASSREPSLRFAPEGAFVPPPVTVRSGRGPRRAPRYRGCAPRRSGFAPKASAKGPTRRRLA